MKRDVQTWVGRSQRPSVERISVDGGHLTYRPPPTLSPRISKTSLLRSATPNHLVGFNSVFGTSTGQFRQKSPRLGSGNAAQGGQSY